MSIHAEPAADIEDHVRECLSDRTPLQMLRMAFKLRIAVSDFASDRDEVSTFDIGPFAGASATMVIAGIRLLLGADQYAVDVDVTGRILVSAVISRVYVCVSVEDGASNTKVADTETDCYQIVLQAVAAIEERTAEIERRRDREAADRDWDDMRADLDDLPDGAFVTLSKDGTVTVCEGAI